MSCFISPTKVKKVERAPVDLNNLMNEFESEDTAVINNEEEARNAAQNVVDTLAQLMLSNQDTSVSTSSGSNKQTDGKVDNQDESTAGGQQGNQGMGPGEGQQGNQDMGPGEGQQGNQGMGPGEGQQGNQNRKPGELSQGATHIPTTPRPTMSPQQIQHATVS